MFSSMSSLFLKKKEPSSSTQLIQGIVNLAKKKQQVDCLILADHDGCLGDHTAQSDIGATLIVLKVLESLIDPSQFQIASIVVACASLRQSYRHDILGMLMNAWQIESLESSRKYKTFFNGSIKHSLITLQKSLSDQFKSIPVLLETFLLPDLFDNSKSHLLKTKNWGTSQQELDHWLKHQTNQQGKPFHAWLHQQPRYRDNLQRQCDIESDWPHLVKSDTHYTDTSKFITLLVQMHFACKDKQNDYQVHAIYFDDREEYAAFFHEIIKKYPQLIPRNVTFLPVYYTYDSINKKASEPQLLSEYVIRGSGSFYPEIVNICRQWLCVLENNLYYSTRICIQKNPAIFIGHFAPIINPTLINLSPAVTTSRLFKSDASKSVDNKRASLLGSELPKITPEKEAGVTLEHAKISHESSPRVTIRKTLSYQRLPSVDNQTNFKR